ncbi:hypothetical protein Tco_0729594 [Tanacetum coccineum]|uniref:Uncharacterized protein n=1 Tax=Tanacetum coccineum TaxID=301880 RepID=A0ABQ4YSE9_9ASTR
MQVFDSRHVAEVPSSNQPPKIGGRRPKKRAYRCLEHLLIKCSYTVLNQVFITLSLRVLSQSYVFQTAKRVRQGINGCYTGLLPHAVIPEGNRLMHQVLKVGNLSIIKDIPLSCLRKLIGDVRNKEYMNESWQSWYKRTNLGKLVRQASTTVCILNEMVFGLSDQTVDDMKSMFCNNIFGWDVSSKRDLQNQLIDSIGSVFFYFEKIEKSSFEQIDSYFLI